MRNDKTLLIVAATYFLSQCFFIPYAVLAADEFVFARHLTEYLHALPYKDFLPYKTVLGYYVLAIPLFFSQHPLTTLFHIKLEIAFINSLALIIASLWASRFFDKKAILLSLLAILANQLFLVNASDLRVDMLATWFCLFAALAILSKRPGFAGVLWGIAFLISQKALWYFIAINIALIMSWRLLLRFNSFALILILIYIAFWSYLASPSTILNSIFYEAFIQSKISLYNEIYIPCWWAVIHTGPLLFLLWPLTWLCQTAKPQAGQRLFVLMFASTALLLFISYKQPFPYNFVFTVPAFFLLYAEFFTSLLTEKPTYQYRFNVFAALITLLYLFIFAALIFLINLPYLYYFSLLLPLCLIANFYTPRFTERTYQISIMLFVAFGIIYPFYATAKVAKSYDGQYQHEMIHLANELIKDGGSYVGGMPFIYYKDQRVQGLNNLIEPALHYLANPSPELAPLLLPSLYLKPVTTEEALASFAHEPVKVVIDNYRIEALNQPLRHYINSQYQPLYGSIYFYAPEIHSPHFHLKFSGHYRLQGKEAVMIDKNSVNPNQIVYLSQGEHISTQSKPYRLVLVPNIQLPKDKTYPQDAWHLMMKNIIPMDGASIL